MIGWRFHENRNVESLECGNDLIQWIAKVDSHFKSFAVAVEKSRSREPSEKTEMT